MPHFAGGQPHAHYFVQQGLGLLQALKGCFFAQMAQETQNQRGADAQLGLGIDTGTVQTVDDGVRTQAVGGMGLRVKEDFGV